MSSSWVFRVCVHLFLSLCCLVEERQYVVFVSDAAMYLRVYIRRIEVALALVSSHFLFQCEKLSGIRMGP